MKYSIDVLTKFVSNVMQKSGLSEDDAEIFAEALIYADSRGIGSHGISRLRTYSKRVESGVIASKSDINVYADSGALLGIDGNNGIGVAVARQVMDLCIERANKFGCCFATVKNGNHFGTGAFFTEYAAKKGMVSFAVSNSEAAVVPTGGSIPMLGTNPLSVSVPAGKYEPLVLDMATSVVARGKVVLAQKEGKSIPEGWCVDKDGNPTTDPKIALEGSMLPFGGPKGYGISLVIDLLCSGLGGSLNSRNTNPFWTDFEHPQDVGFFIGAFDPEKIRPRADYEKRIDNIFDEFKKSPTAPGVDEVMIPGEIENRKAKQANTEGIQLSKNIIDDLINVANYYEVAHPFAESDKS